MGSRSKFTFILCQLVMDANCTLYTKYIVSKGSEQLPLSSWYHNHKNDYCFSYTVYTQLRVNVRLSDSQKPLNLTMSILFIVALSGTPSATRVVTLVSYAFDTHV